MSMTNEQAYMLALTAGSKATAAATASATEAWLAEHVDPDTGYVIDDTLSVTGAAADAKKVGDEIADLKSAFGKTIITGVKMYVDYSTTENKITFPNDCQLVATIAGTFTVHSLSNNVIDSATLNASGSGAIKIFIDTTNWAFHCLAYNNATIPSNYVYIATLRKTSGYDIAFVADFPWSVNGVPYNQKELYLTENIIPSTFPGYFGMTGAWNSPSSTYTEVYTGVFRCNVGDTFVANVTFSETHENWGAWTVFDRNGDFVARAGNGVINSTITVSQSNAYYVVYMCRSFNDESIVVTAPKGSYVGIDIYMIKYDSLFQYNSIGQNFGMILGHANYMDVDSVNKTITIPQDTIILYNGTYKIVSSSSVIDCSSISSSAIIVTFDKTNQTFIPRIYSTSMDMYRAEFPVAYIRFPYSNAPTCTVCASFPWSVDGKPYGIAIPNVAEYQLSEYSGNAVASINHRGYSTDAPENTLPAYKLSKQKGFLRVETDVSFTQDGVAVLLHDNTINRTARNLDGTEISETIAIGSIDYDDLANYDFGIWKSSVYAGTPIPTFEQFIVLCRNLGLHPYIEIKSNGTYTQAQIEGLVDAVKRNGMQGKVTWISFSAAYLTYVKNYDAYARLGYLASTVDSTVISTASALKTTQNEVFVDSNDTTKNAADLCYAAGLPLEIWTINTTAGVTALDPYVSGVTSDSIIAAKALYDANIS